MKKKLGTYSVCAWAIACCLISFIGCATPVAFTNQPLQRFDKNTLYRVDDQEDGFTITVSYSRYQFIPESEAVTMAGKSALLSIAYDVADSRRRPIEQINEQRIKMSLGFFWFVWFDWFSFG